MAWIRTSTNGRHLAGWCGDDNERSGGSARNMLEEEAGRSSLQHLSDPNGWWRDTGAES